MDGRRVWPEWFDSDVAAPPPLDIAAVIAYCEQRVPPHALYQVRMEAIVDRHAVTLVERRAPWRPEFGPEWTRSPVLSRITSLRGSEPWAGYDELTAVEVQAVLSDADDERANQTRSYERGHKNRTSVLNAAARQHSNA
jgi:hypothetical protein